MTTEVCDLSRADTDTEHPADAPVAFWGGVLAMTLCVFALIASEFMPVSLLSPIAADLRVTEGMAGQGIAISGAFAVLTSLLISSLAGAMNRKTLLLLLTGLIGSLRRNRRDGAKLRHLYDRASAHWCRRRRFLVYVSSNRHATGSGFPGATRFGHFQ
ncbi:major facilitator superfamily transport protein [Advenella kashmirensis WT001]|uniref:Major facilitator superfamily transport protein n=1 Tax=Advenella kashmirensis (strain DSM 17095 / LMG 22695 / WT001) TaxID=1036672 RepID=I3UFG7_ADVKW|nr:major facilitator superfamily transport protein [Advenella kashmirensis WT001]